MSTNPPTIRPSLSGHHRSSSSINGIAARAEPLLMPVANASVLLSGSWESICSWLFDMLLRHFFSTMRGWILVLDVYVSKGTLIWTNLAIVILRLWSLFRFLILVILSLSLKKRKVNYVSKVIGRWGFYFVLGVDFRFNNLKYKQIILFQDFLLLELDPRTRKAIEDNDWNSDYETKSVLDTFSRRYKPPKRNA